MEVVEQFCVAGPVGRVGGLRCAGEHPGIPAVFVHPINGAAEHWSAVMRRLSGRPVISVDLRGHGRSQPGGGYGAADYAADVEAVMNGLGIPHAHLVGASFGASAALMLAALRPQRVVSVTAIGGALRVDLDADAAVRELHTLGPAAFFTKFAKVSFAPGTDPRVLADTVAWATRADISVTEQIIRAAFAADISAIVGRVVAPALVLTGAQDRTCPPAAGAALAAALGTECRVLDGHGHLLHLEDPELVARLVDDHARRSETRMEGG
ncbi:alpha/beta fold hydrolase [Mycobacterium botniense]|uniref:Alpha/beta hydrolase n=1 Tax=Mycobacterium botniense TaxID=84962 RepID=A0A7I9XT72_9MYCO|nr:alpha/beta fold hydrolase [Mycobacterium botniense]GFG73192.1 alpha/beta hydrolase [Mycobacterium botniense]